MPLLKAIENQTLNFIKRRSWKRIQFIVKTNRRYEIERYRITKIVLVTPVIDVRDRDQVLKWV